MHGTFSLSDPPESSLISSVRFFPFLPVFEHFNKYLIFRTWTIGAYKIGDLIWNEKTYEQVLQGIQSKNFIVSMKYGDTDFFDQLRLDPLFISQLFQ
jgi:hypothetical protein